MSNVHTNDEKTLRFVNDRSGLALATGSQEFCERTQQVFAKSNELPPTEIIDSIQFDAESK